VVVEVVVIVAQLELLELMVVMEVIQMAIMQPLIVVEGAVGLVVLAHIPEATVALALSLSKYLTT
jgi:hypothetical protein